LVLKQEVDKCLRALPGVKDTIVEIAVSPNPPDRCTRRQRAGQRRCRVHQDDPVRRGHRLRQGRRREKHLRRQLACALAQLLEAQGRAAAWV